MLLAKHRQNTLKWLVLFFFSPCYYECKCSWEIQIWVWISSSICVEGVWLSITCLESVQPQQGGMLKQRERVEQKSADPGVSSMQKQSRSTMIQQMKLLRTPALEATAAQLSLLMCLEGSKR